MSRRTVAPSALLVFTLFLLPLATFAQRAEEPASGLYLAFFEEAPLALYSGDVPGLEATNPRAAGRTRLDPRSPESLAYLRYLSERQQAHLGRIRQALGRSPEVVFRYRAAGNGVALRIVASEAARITSLPGVVRVVADYTRELDTDRGPEFIGADAVWDGVLGFPATEGDGVVVAVIDSGVNMDHPSFSDTPVDGHVYTNPFGSGNFVGWCDPANPNHDPSFLCNDKLIGAWDFVDDTPPAFETDGPEDSDGHGSHTASTAAGNGVDFTGDGVADASGVARHANLITYDCCYVDPGSGLGLCPFASTSAAVDQILLDGVVDAINYSISGGTNPWGGDIDTFFLSAVAAGIYVSASAGNSGPGASTVNHFGPWVSTTGASTHDRLTHEITLTASGGVNPPGPIVGRSRTGGHGPASIVFAGDFGDADCLTPFPINTWTNDEIVVCNRGDIARVMKGQNVAIGGAGGLVLANVAGGATTVIADPHAIPAIHVDQADGDALKAWLSTGAGHTATVSDSSILLDPAAGDVMAGFSSRGPVLFADILKPDVTGPGTGFADEAIIAAIATGFFDEMGLPPYGGPEFFYLSGTSMSSPHNAGAGALMAAVHPTWTPSEIKSAMVTTGFTEVVKEDGVTPADPFDFGGGRLDLSRAPLASLVLDETEAAYQAADPNAGGDPRTLNVPGMQHSACEGACFWTRTVKATGNAGAWSASADGPAWMELRVLPESFTLAPGETQELMIQLIVRDGAPLGTWSFADVVLAPTPTVLPEQRLPIAVIPTALGDTVFEDGFESGDTSAWDTSVGG